MHTTKRAVSFDTAYKGAIAPLCSQYLPDNQRNTPPLTIAATSVFAPF